MFYDKELMRWVVEDRGREAWYTMLCGESLKLHMGDAVLSGRLELTRTSWCILIDDVALGLLEHRRYRVTVQI